VAQLALEGQGVLITGGGGGLGSAAAAWLARDGAAVTIMGRTEATLVAAKDRIREVAGPEATVEHFVGDALDAEDVQGGLAAAEELAGRLAIAVSVVGSGGGMKPLLMFDEAEVLEVLRRNIISAFLLIRHATPLMVKGGGGSIVCVSSTVAKLSWPFMAIYNAAKSGLEGLVRAAALELGHLNVRVNAVRPGLTRTGTTGRMFEDDVLPKFIDEKPLGRTGVPDDIAAGIRYLAGPESSWVTGKSLGIDGGHELTKAPYLEALVRQQHGDAAIDAALAGVIPR
jgi:NAD(P)-dependent dehydrogenase (short-subunit alcohol dehydrogenase family)